MFWPGMRKEYQRVEDGTDALANDNSEAKPLPPPPLSYGVKAIAFTLRAIQVSSYALSPLSTGFLQFENSG